MQTLQELSFEKLFKIKKTKQNSEGLKLLKKLFFKKNLKNYHGNYSRNSLGISLEYFHGIVSRRID